MHKHQSKPAIRKRKFKNANFSIGESARNTLLDLFGPVECGEDFACSYLTESYLTKYCDEGIVPGEERRRRAIAKFRECELKNAVTNDWLLNVDMEYNILPRLTLKSFLRFARRLTRDILGPLRDEVVLGSFSGGASTSRGRTESLPALKFTGQVDVTEGAIKYMDILRFHAPMLREYNIFNDVKVIESNVLFTVPKKTDIDRCACKEPDINMFLQKGAGTYIRKRLRRFGINLNDQSVNRGLAKVGSETQRLCTIDLSSASDSISREVVRHLLPYEWFEYLNDIRVHSTDIDGEPQQLEMFSSMGNGFTFELESLIFFVLAKSVAYFEGISGVISVYGDDIIAPTGVYDPLVFVFGKFGFTVNEDKSFSTGPFRESCGGHYYNGIDVTPFYLRSLPKRLVDLIRVANQLRRWLLADPGREHIFPVLVQQWMKLKEFVPKTLWGGYDYDVDTKLVTPGFGKYVLQRITSPVKFPDTGAYIHWHNTNWNRTSEVNPSREPESTNQMCRLRRTNSGAAGTTELLYQELFE